MPKVVDIQQRREVITDAAARVIARAGIEAATMREVAAEAGWTTGAITHYFDDKRDLLLATFQSSLARRRSLRPPSTASAGDRLRSSLEGALPLDDERRRHWLVTLTCCTQSSDDPALAAAQRDAYREFRDHVAGLLPAAGPTNGRDARARAEHLIAAVDGVAIQAMFDPESWPAERQIEALDTVLAASSGT